MILDKFSLIGKTAIITGGEGLLGGIIKRTIRELGGTYHSIDLKDGADWKVNIAVYSEVLRLAHLPCDILINNAVGNQKPDIDPGNRWEPDLAVGLTGALNMLTILGPSLIERKGVVLNIGSDLSLIGPDMSLYPEGMRKPVSYSVVKHGIIGLTRYVAATYPKIRCNCLCPGSIEQGQRVPKNIMGRNARIDEMKGPVAFMLSDASSFMTGATVVVDGGRSVL